MVSGSMDNFDIMSANLHRSLEDMLLMIVRRGAEGSSGLRAKKGSREWENLFGFRRLPQKDQDATDDYGSSKTDKWIEQRNLNGRGVTWRINTHSLSNEASRT